jgi:hypothetical protein
MNELAQRVADVLEAIEAGRRLTRAVDLAVLEARDNLLTDAEQVAWFDAKAEAGR